jgi:hypothetical protein
MGPTGLEPGSDRSSERASFGKQEPDNWVREEKLKTALPNPPKVTAGEVVVHKTRELVGA